ncbi:hypothetical protein EW146_g3879 [Bondarzewia mesenterica]|uniref:T6SS Phospholipase effector Tle1-like catalytic domain-containing protein n=1 Tax=Bondarzewia mesenterica TaxID=1095465 RepID=A0A4V3XFB5_9AGAM|nr:hypothetical protein EW146_g3879 [Bondarzewia mesenterica]
MSPSPTPSSSTQSGSAASSHPSGTPTLILPAREGEYGGDHQRPSTSSSHKSSPRPGNRSFTDPDPTHLRIKKRIILCCDGTWQDGITVKERWGYTNVLRLARAINHVDARIAPPMPQIVFYQSGVGTESSTYAAVLDGATGATLGDKVQEAYAFIAHNYVPGDEIFLFGFSRGAYTARMIAEVIGHIGVLDRTEMDHFAQIFINFQKRGKATNASETAELDAKLAPWTGSDSPGRKRANYEDDSFSVKCVGVFDTVGSLGLPEELTMNSKKIKTLFGFSDSKLGLHVERAYQALALNETRADFNCNKFYQQEEGKCKHQILKQCWFAGSHSDIGGGWEEHDLSDLTLFWMAAQVGDILSLDIKYLASIPNPNAPWGEQEPHDSVKGVFALADTIKRHFPTSFNPVTQETIHQSVLYQDTILPDIKDVLAQNPELLNDLMPLEEELKANWPYVSPADGESKRNARGNKTAKVNVTRHRSLMVRTRDVVTRRSMTESRTKSPLSPKSPQRSKNWLTRISEEISLGAFVRDLMDRT